MGATECERIIGKGQIPESFLLEEMRSDYLVDVNRKKLWMIELDLLLEFDRVCKKHGLNYYLEDGTLLGAVRHNGFIPWDDDIDVCMPRSDYEAFLMLEDEFSSPYFLQTPINDAGFYYAHARLRNSNTAAIDLPFAYQNINHGIFIDIVPLDKVDYELGKEDYPILHKLILDNSVAMRLANPYLNERDQERVRRYPGGDPINRYCEIQRIARKYEFEDVDHLYLSVAHAYGYEAHVFPSAIFDGSRDCLFESFPFPIPKGFDEMLRITYGDYLTLPPIEKRGVWHGNIVFNTDIPYFECLEAVRNKIAERYKENG